MMNMHLNIHVLGAVWIRISIIFFSREFYVQPNLTKQRLLRELGVRK